MVSMGALTLILLGLVLQAVFAHTARLPFIIGGKDVETPGKYPWQGSLQYIGKHACGCVLLSTTWTITAGKCIGFTPYHTVVLGMHDILSKKQGKPVTYAVQEIIVHPDYDLSVKGSQNDLALLKLATAADLTSTFIGTINMAAADSANNVFSDCVITGWGGHKFVNGLPVSPDALQEASVTLYASTATCQQKLEQLGGAPIGDSQLCVDEKANSNACTSDRGGPLVCKYKNKLHLAGIYSWGPDAELFCDTSYPTVYTRIASFRNWISSVTKGDL